ncbi:hypothetical protein JSQ81_02955 [Sporosarcina sp. Marseille-Q4063]|uniref:hypothetical protein n=1 Tax=Sporosarcina sp. Marseille-Q4063 TaxID=2810514 RepID=UPI001BAF7EF7|nr:hypothetical protein [Sporosarcina sp. Marseille-Q4063]QUW22562.1 hypothetical protein JSQ81_02955 [Sporosarcina sp. Marseille-Q4063]
MKFVFDINQDKALRVIDEIAFNEVTGEYSIYDNTTDLVPIMKSSYHVIVENISNWYGSSVSEPKWIEEINVELLKYGI